ncbi:hypothetical protein ABBQ38_011048 [Trebouxia sp. C0009 RCD-2024]
MPQLSATTIASSLGSLRSSQYTRSRLRDSSSQAYLSCLANDTFWSVLLTCFWPPPSSPHRISCRAPVVQSTPEVVMQVLQAGCGVNKLELAVMPPQSSTYTHRKGLTSIHTVRTRGCQAGQTLDQRLEVHCHSSKGQHAHAKQQGPNISLLAPALQKQWDHTANAGLGDIDIRPYSNKKVHWICDQCPDGHPHSWSATVCNRTNGTGCPQCKCRTVCKHNSLATRAPLVAAEWDYEANTGIPHDVVSQSNSSVHWHCAVCGCEWEATPNHRVGKGRSGCPHCVEDAKSTYQEQAANLCRVSTPSPCRVGPPA